MERKQVRQEEDAEAASEKHICVKLDLRFFGESGFEQNAESCQAEIHIHRQFLRALHVDEPEVVPDVLPGETLRQLSKRVWLALISYKFTTIFDDGYVSMMMFNPTNQTFDGGPSPGLCYGVRDAAKPDWFDKYWVPPADCQNGEADQPIDISALPKLPPAPIKTRKPEAKPDRVPPPAIDALVTGYETPVEEQDRLHGLGTFGVRIS
jgi:hypothetical protein